MLYLIMSSAWASIAMLMLQEHPIISALNGFFSVANFGIFIGAALENHRNELLNKLKEK